MEELNALEPAPKLLLTELATDGPPEVSVPPAGLDGELCSKLAPELTELPGPASLTTVTVVVAPETVTEETELAEAEAAMLWGVVAGEIADAVKGLLPAPLDKDASDEDTKPLAGLILDDTPVALPALDAWTEDPPEAIVTLPLPTTTEDEAVAVLIEAVGELDTGPDAITTLLLREDPDATPLANAVEATVAAEEVTPWRLLAEVTACEGLLAREAPAVGPEDDGVTWFDSWLAPKDDEAALIALDTEFTELEAELIELADGPAAPLLLKPEDATAALLIEALAEPRLPAEFVDKPGGLEDGTLEVAADEPIPAVAEETAAAGVLVWVGVEAVLATGAPLVLATLELLLMPVEIDSPAEPPAAPWDKLEPPIEPDGVTAAGTLDEMGDDTALLAALLLALAKFDAVLTPVRVDPWPRLDVATVLEDTTAAGV
ncbi:hypothetical protein VPNG_07478 [Cytospora leucostoma]|uniref:Uncharacterized protein n=1 Tax=Cytospora leucostoma TaxID=1230097 RepID=A0A423WS38_9PEZI|nr:hypothetical protein VPNG_07478 [Cytospora leucostoma]